MSTTEYQNEGRDVSQTRSPCSDVSFSPPVYQIEGFAVQKIYTGYPPLKYRANFTLSDVANNYSMRCSSSDFVGNEDLSNGTHNDYYGYSYCDAPNTQGDDHLNLRYSHRFYANRVNLILEWICTSREPGFP